MKIMIDTNIYDSLIDDSKTFKLVEQLMEKELVKILTTHIQEDEVEQTKVTDKREELKKVPITNKIGTSLFVIGTSRIGEARLGSGAENGVEFTRIQRSNSKHTNDAIIAFTAAKEADVLVTEDAKLRAKLKAQSTTLEVWDYKRFTDYINSL